MQKKVISLVLALLLALTGLVRAEELTVNTGTVTNAYVPVYGFYADAYLKAEFVTPAADLASMAESDITSMRFQIDLPALDAWTGTFQVFLMEVDYTTMSAFQGIEGATIVYEGPLDGTGEQLVVDFTTPYTYHGGNLLIGVYQPIRGNYKSITFKGINAPGASVQNYSYTSLEAITPIARDFLPQTTFVYEASAPAEHRLVALVNEEEVDALNVGTRPVGAWMEPFHFQLKSEGAAATVTNLDFTPNDGLFVLGEIEMPFLIGRDETVDLDISTNGVEAGVVERQFVAIYQEAGRTASVWPVTVEFYAPEIPDVVEMPRPHDEITFPYVETVTGMHNDYTLPFPDIEEGNDAVFELVIDADAVLNASVSDGENGKVALYTEDFNGEGGPMAHNNYTGPQINGRDNRSAAVFDFEGGLQDWTTIDNDGDGNDWFHSSNSMALSGYDYTGLGHDGTDGFAVSASYSDITYTSIDADNYLVSPQKYLMETGSNLNFFVDYGSDGYPDYFEVCVATADNPTASDFTMVWGGTADRSGNHAPVRFSHNNRYNNWREHTVDLSAYAGQEVWVAFHHLDYDQYEVWIDDVTLTYSENTNPNPGSLDISAGPVIENLPVTPGTYYLVASSTSDPFTVEINTEPMPCPEQAYGPTPADDTDGLEPASVTLQWHLPNFATEYRLVFGTTYYPDPEHPQSVLVDWTRDLAESYTVTDLWNNTNYFWRVDVRNDSEGCETLGQIWGFTTHLNKPHDLVANDYTIFDDQEVTLSWTAIQDRTFRTYYIYRNGEKVGETNTNDVSATSYVDGPLEYNMDGYEYYVTAIYDEGESMPSNTITVQVSGYTNETGINGYVWEQDGETGIENAIVTLTGQDEFGDTQTYTATTDANGYYSKQVYAGTYTNAVASKESYQDVVTVHPLPFTVAYDTQVDSVNFLLDENFDPVCTVIAEYYPDSLDPESPYVKVYWGCGLPGEEIIEPFETGDFSLFDWQIDPNYPWTITTIDPYEGTYCMKSGGAGVNNVISNMTVTVNIPADGEMSFFGKISSEQGWDYGYFFIDGTQMGSYTGAGSWGERTFPITAGDHTFQWRYEKDGSVNNNDDCFYVDYITFYKRPEPLGAGWHTYLEGEFNDALRSNLTDQPAFGYHYPTSITGQYNGFQLTKVSMFSDDLYGAVGGNYTCNIYQGGNTPGAGTLVSTITVDLPVGLGEWVDWDLDTPVAVNGSQDLWVIWQVNVAGGLGYPAGMCNSDSNPNGDWWNAGEGWENYGGGVWTMRNYFTDRSGRSVVLGSAKNVQNAPLAMSQCTKIDSRLRTIAKGDNRVVSESINPNASSRPLVMADSNRALSHYRVYRTNCYNDGPYTEENTVLLATVWVPDTVYIDVDWPDVAPGIYKWGVGTVYAGNRGEEIAGPIHWSEPINVNNAKATRADYTYGFESDLEGWTVLDVNTGEGTWLHSSANPGGYDYTTHAHGGTGFAMCYSYIDYVGSYNTDSYLVSPQKYSIENGSTLTFYADNANDTYPENFSVCVATTSDAPTASDFTQVWSGGAKGNSNAKATVRHDNNRYDNWREHSIDLSAYAGQEVWIAFHDVNYDQYEIWIDDVTIVASSGTGPTPPTPGGDNLNQLALPRESETIWSNCLEKNMYLGDGLVDINVLLNSADSPEGVEVSFINLNENEQANNPMASITLDETGFYSWESFRKGDYLVKIDFDGYYPIEDTVHIWDETHLRYVMTEIIYGVDNLYVSRTGWAMWDAQGLPSGGGGGQGGSGITFTEDFEGGLNGWNVLTVNNDGGSWIHSNDNLGGYDYSTLAHSGTGFAMCYSFVDYVGAYNTDSYLITPEKYDIVNGSTLSFWADNANDSYPESFSVCVATADNPSAGDFTQVWSGSAKGNGGAKAEVRHDADRYENWRSHSIDLSAYAGQSVYIAFHDVNYDMYEIWIDDVELSVGAKSGDRHLEGFKVMCTSIDGEPIFNTNTVNPFCQLETESLVEGEHYICKVAAVYSTGMSDWTECVWQYESCEHYAGTLNGVTVNGTTISWDYPTGTGPVPPPQPGENAVVVLNVPTDIWGDGSGYQMLLDADATMYTQLAAAMYFDEIGSFDGFEYTIPENADYGINPANIVVNNSVAIEIPAGTYDYAIINPDKVSTIWFAGNSGNAESKGDDMVYEAGKMYTYTLSSSGTGDMINLTISDRNGMVSVPTGENVATLASAIRTADNLANRDGDWYYYDNGVNVDGIGTGGGQFYWAVMFPAGSYNGNALTKVSAYDYMAMTGNVTIYNDGATAPANQVGQMNVTFTGAEDFIEFTFAEPVTIDPTKNVWVVFFNESGATYPAACCDNTGDANGRWVSMDGVDWMDILEAAPTLNYTWMIRAYIEEGTTPPPTPGETDCIGAMIFADGEWEAFVPVPTNTYEYTGNASEVCVRMVYPGTAELPDNNYYYAMSCPECVEPALVCESDITIHGEALTTTDQSKIWWGEQPVPGNEWLSYLSLDDEILVESTLGAQGMPFYWGCMYPASMIVEQGFTSGVIDQVWYIDVGDPELTGNCEVHIYLGGDNAPQTEITSQTYYINGEQGLKPIQLDQPVAIDGTQNLWVMFYTDGSIDAPAPLTTYLGDPNTMWMGVQDMWVPLSSFGYTYSFIQFVHVSNGGKGDFLTMDDGTATHFTNGMTRETNLVVKPVSMSSFNATSLRDDNGAPVKYNVYRSTDNVNYTLIGEVPYVEGQTYYEYIDTPETSADYYYQVRTVYEDGCESVPALNADDLTQDYVLIAVNVGMNEQSDNVALFPNPTKGNVTIQASGMNHITVVSVLGQVVFDTEVNADEYTLNMAQFNKGMYMVRVHTANGMTVKRVTVMQ